MAAETYFRNFIDGDHGTFRDHLQLSPREQLRRRLLVADVIELPELLDDVSGARGAQGLDLLAGGPPCQGFSLAGRRAMDDERNRLVWTFLDLAAALHPKVVLMENVPAIHAAFESGGKSSTLSMLADALGQAGDGYVTVILFLRADHYGVPQRRKRAFLIGVREDIAAFLDIRPGLWDSDTMAPRHPVAPPPALDCVSAQDALWDIASSSDYLPFDSAPSTVDPSYVRWARSDLRARGAAPTKVPNHLFRSHRSSTATRFQLLRLFKAVGISDRLFADAEAMSPSSLQTELLAAQRLLPIETESGTFETLDRLAEGVVELASSKHSQRVLDPECPSPTVTTLPDDFIHYAANRTLTVREMARLQSFPDSFVFFGKETTGGVKRRSEVPQYSQVGNAVPPKLALAIGSHLRRMLTAVRE